MFDNTKAIKPVYFGGLDAVFDERGSMFLTMRKTQWVQEGNEPDESKAKLELRKYRVTEDGERADKGIAFLTEEGPHELAKVLVHEGYGHTKDILKELKGREDFKDSVEHLYDDENESGSGEFFDMRNILLAEEPDENEDDEDE